MWGVSSVGSRPANTYARQVPKFIENGQLLLKVLLGEALLSLCQCFGLGEKVPSWTFLSLRAWLFLRSDLIEWALIQAFLEWIKNT